MRISSTNALTINRPTDHYLAHPKDNHGWVIDDEGRVQQCAARHRFFAAVAAQ